MDEPVNDKNPAVAPSALSAGLGIAVTGGVSFFLKEEPNKLTALDFCTLFIGDGRMVIDYGTGKIEHELCDVEKVIFRLSKTAQGKNIPEGMDEQASR